MAEQITFDFINRTVKSDPPAQRHSSTSRQAANAIRSHVPTLRERVYAFIENCGPVTDEEISITLGLDPSTARPRRIELVNAGLVIAHHETHTTRSGRAATAWIARSAAPGAPQTQSG